MPLRECCTKDEMLGAEGEGAGSVLSYVTEPDSRKQRRRSPSCNSLLQLPPLTFPHQLTIELPYSKSVAARQILRHYLKHQSLSDLIGSGVIGAFFCDDLKVLYHAVEQLAQRQGSSSCKVECGESGTAIRFLIIASLFEPGDTQLVGSPRLIERIKRDDLQFITQLGGDYQWLSEESTLIIFPPKEVPDTTLTNRWSSSQYLSAIELCNEAYGTKIAYHFSPDSPSYSYLQLTQSVISKGDKYPLERDWSAASFWYQLLATNPQVEQIVFPRLNLDSVQPDRAVADLYRSFGIETKESNEGVQITRVGECTAQRIVMDLSQNLDLFLPIALTAVALDCPFEITGIHLLRNKESDRIASLIENIQPYGVTGIELTEDSIAWSGTRTPGAKEVSIHPHNDHRVAMAFGIWGSNQSEIQTTILTPDVVHKSYPSFFDDLLRYRNDL